MLNHTLQKPEPVGIPVENIGHFHSSETHIAVVPTACVDMQHSSMVVVQSMLQHIVVTIIVAGLTGNEG